MNPSQIRRSKNTVKNALELKLYYRPPYNWQHCHSFLRTRLIKGLEWTGNKSYGRNFTWQTEQGECKGEFTATHQEKHHRFDVNIEIDNLHLLKAVVNNIRRILDLDTDIKTIEKCLRSNGFDDVTTGIRLIGTWSLFEAGIRAILGQQISVVAAQNLVTQLIHKLGEKAYSNTFYFPSTSSIAKSELNFLKIPQSRKQTLKNLANYCLDNSNSEEQDNWLILKGIGPWTVDYAKMRGSYAHFWCMTSVQDIFNIFFLNQINSYIVRGEVFSLLSIKSVSLSA